MQCGNLEVTVAQGEDEIKNTAQKTDSLVLFLKPRAQKKLKEPEAVGSFRLFHS
jgi:hypothetical protein